MASVTLDRVWLHLASDLGAYETFWSTKPDDSRAKAGEVRAYAGGRLRQITRVLRRRTLGLRLVDVTAEQLETIEAWQGLTVLYRDEGGNLMFGTFYDLSVDPYPFGQGYEVAFSFQQVTASAEV